MSNKKFPARAISLALVIINSPLLFADEYDELLDDEIFALEEVIVTARKRQESLQDSPVAVSAFSADALKEAGISNTRDLQQSVPGLTFSEQGTKSPAIFIRGIGQREATAALDPAVGVYINGIYIARTDSQLLDTVDTQSIQVLRGPQGTLFGKNNTGGALLVTTQEPHTEQFEAYVDATVGNFGRQNVKVGANIPLNDETLSMRVSLGSTKLDGYMKNVIDGKYYADEERLAATARIYWQASDIFSVDVFSYWSKVNERGLATSCIFSNPEANIAALKYPQNAQFQTSCERSEELLEDNKISINGPSQSTMESNILATTLSWEYEDYEVKSITGYSWQKDIIKENDQDATDLALLGNGTLSLTNTLSAAGVPFDDEERDQISQELQLIGSAFDESLQFTTGLFLAYERMENNPFTQLIGPNSFAYNETDILGQPHNVAINTFFATQSEINNQTAALFFQGTYDVNEWFQLTLGVRHTWEKRERDLQTYEIDMPELVDTLNQQGIAISELEIVPGVTIPGLYEYPGASDFDEAAAYYANRGLPLGTFTSDDVGHADLKKDETWNKLTPTLTASFNVPEDILDESTSMDSVLLYFTYSEGFKAGGFENKGGALELFEPEEVVSREIGIKIDALDRRLRFNTALYYMNYTDMQVRVAQTGETIADVELFISNAGKSTVKGIEMELTVMPVSGLLMTASANYTDASYDEFLMNAVERTPGGLENIIVDRSDEPFGSIPEITWSFTASYDIAADHGLYTPRLIVYYRDEVYTGIDFQAADYEQSTLDDYTIANFRLAFTPSALDSLDMTLFVNNLTDEDYIAGGFHTAGNMGAAIVTKGMPRSYGLELRYSYY